MKTIRCFLAVKLDLNMVRGVAEAQKGLREVCRELDLEVAWVPPPNMHITLRFLGQVTEPLAYALKEMLELSVRGIAPFELSSMGIGAFPDAQHPRTIWAGTDAGSGELCDLASNVTARLVEAGFRFEDKPFRPHVTIGRVKKGGGEAFAKCLASLGEQRYGSSVVRNIYCYRSDLQPSGAEYHSLWRLPFGKKWDRPEQEISQMDSDQNEPFYDFDDDSVYDGESEESAANKSDRDLEGSENT